MTWVFYQCWKHITDLQQCGFYLHGTLVQIVFIQDHTVSKGKFHQKKILGHFILCNLFSHISNLSDLLAEKRAPVEKLGVFAQPFLFSTLPLPTGPYFCVFLLYLMALLIPKVTAVTMVLQNLNLVIILIKCH